MGRTADHRPWVAIPIAALAVGCFYTGPINRRPVAKITKLDADPHHVGQTILLHAAKSEDDDDMEATWSAFACADGGQCVRLGDEVTIARLADPFSLTIPTQEEVELARFERIEVELVVEDPHGAFGRDVLSISVVNQAPELLLQDSGSADPRPGGGYVLGLPVHLVASVVDLDMDAVQLSWQTPRPPVGGGSDPDAVVFEVDGAEDRRQLVADVPGLWEVEVEADDGAGGVVSQSRQILIERDHPPCIDFVDPAAVSGANYIVDRAAGPRRFAVLSVTDALDVFPLPGDSPPEMAEAEFAWKIATPDTGDELIPIAGHAAADYVLDPGAFSPGDVVILRVDVFDRVDRTPCADADPTCSLEGDDCYQRLTWGIEIR